MPVFSDLSKVLHLDGPANDLVDTLGALPGAAEGAPPNSVPATIKALDDGQPNIAQLRPYTPDLLAFLGRFGQATSNYDANGHYLRVQPTGINFFNWNSATSVLDPVADHAAVPGLRQRLLQPLPRRLDAADRRLQPVPRRRRPGRDLQPG